MKKVDNFLLNPEFVRWVKHPDLELDAYWKNWMEAHPESIVHIKKAKEIILGIKFQDIQIDENTKSELLANILKESSGFENPIDEKIIRYEPYEPNKNLWEKISLISRVAAILIISFLFSWMIFHRPAAEPEFVAEEVRFLEKSTAAGEKLYFTLPDGSDVWLNSSSKLVFPENFGENERRVSLEGEGFFDVASDFNRPFSVNANGIITTALGTSFNIFNREEQDVRISLVTGKVIVKEESHNESFLLVPGQQFIYDTKESKGKVGEFYVFHTTAWKDGVLVFKNADLPEVKTKLEQWYGVKINLVNAKGKHWNFSGEYKNQMLETVLNSMSYVEEFEYIIEGKEVELRF
jgi:transmembrane sensor